MPEPTEEVMDMVEFVEPAEFERLSRTASSADEEGLATTGGPTEEGYRVAKEEEDEEMPRASGMTIDLTKREIPRTKPVVVQVERCSLDIVRRLRGKRKAAAPVEVVEEKKISLKKRGCSRKNEGRRPQLSGAYLRAREERLVETSESEGPTDDARSEVYGSLTSLEDPPVGELSTQPTPDLVSRVLERVQEVEDIGRKSKNMKGTFQKALKECATEIREISGVVGLRATAAANPRSAQSIREVAALRRSLAEANTTIQMMREQIRELQEQVKSASRPQWVDGGLKRSAERREKEWRAKGMSPPPELVDVELENEMGNYVAPPNSTRPRRSVPQNEVILRPSLGGVRKPIPTPGGQRSEVEKLHEKITQQIAGLLDLRERLVKGEQQPEEICKDLRDGGMRGEEFPPLPRSARPDEEAEAVPGPSHVESPRAEERAVPRPPRPGPSRADDGAVPGPSSAGDDGSMRVYADPPQKRRRSRKKKGARGPPEMELVSGSKISASKKDRASGLPENPPPPTVSASRYAGPRGMKDGSRDVNAPGRESYAVVLGRRARRGAMATPIAVERNRQGSQPVEPWRGSAVPPGRSSQPGLGRRRNRGGASAVTLTCPEGQYAEVMRAARTAVDLRELGIVSLRMRRAITGALLIEVPGEGSAAKAAQLREKMAQALEGREGVRLAQPTRTAEIRVHNLDESIAAADIVMALRGLVGDPGRPSDVTVGELRPAPGGMYSAWVRCPLDMASAAVRLGHLIIGWARCRVEELRKRPLQCFRCHKYGHVGAKCPGGPDRSACCYRCGAPGHQARGCTAPPRCTVCSEAGVRANHRSGGRACNPPRARRRPGGAVAMPARSVRGGAGEEEMEVDPVPSLLSPQRGTSRPGSVERGTARSTPPQRGMDSTGGMEVDVVPSSPLHRGTAAVGGAGGDVVPSSPSQRGSCGSPSRGNGVVDVIPAPLPRRELHGHIGTETAEERSPQP